MKSVHMDKKAKELYGLSQVQRRMIYAQMQYSDTSMYVIGGAAILTGDIDKNLLIECIKECIDENDAFRIQLCKDEEYYQYFSDDNQYNIFETAFDDNRDLETNLKEFEKTVFREPFDLLNHPLYAFYVFQTSNGCGYIIKIHHVIADGWSMQLIVKAISNFYSMKKDNYTEKDRQKGSCLTFLYNEQNYHASKQFNEDQEFWKQTFIDYSDAEEIGDKEILSQRLSFQMPAGKITRMNEICERFRISPFQFFILIYILREYLIKGKTDIVVGMPVLGRNGKREKEIVGMSVKEIPLRIKLNGGMDVKDLVKEICRNIGECYLHQRYSCTDLIKELSNQGKAVGDLYNVCINYYGTDMSASLPDIAVESREFFSGEQEYHLQVIIREWQKDSMQLDFDYQYAYCSEEEIKLLYEEMMLCIDELSSEKEKIGQFSLISENDRKILKDFNNTAQEFEKISTVMDLFFEQVKRIPDEIAIECEDSMYSYEQVLKMVCCYEERIKKLADIKNKIVIVMLSHSAETVAAILAVMKSGGIFLPIDKNSPQKRTEYIIADSKPDLIISDEGISHCGNVKEYIVDKLDREYLKDIPVNFVNNADEDGLAYIIYTSGTTGKPKGACITQKGLNNYIMWAIREYIDDWQISMPLFSSLSFDMTITSLFLPIMSGHRMIVYPGGNEKEYVLHQIARENKCSIIKLTPSHLTILLEWIDKATNLRKIIVGGENLKTELAREVYDKLNQNVEIINEYGPTETVVGCSIQKFDSCETEESVPIGRPIANTKIRILNDLKREVPLGEKGEIYIEGIQVSRGYLYQEEMSRKSFIDLWGNGTLAYKTGDLGFVSGDGILHYCGRKDNQVKLNGYRIEIEEIRKSLLQNEKIEDAVIAIKDQKIIIAYYISKEDCSGRELAGYLADLLPYYMVPHLYYRVDKFPLTDNGKIDTEKLLAIRSEAMDSQEETPLWGEQIELLTQNLSKLLRMPVKEQDNFFMLGGDSIKAIQLSSRLSEYGYQLRMKDILTNPVINDMAKYMRKDNKTGVTAVEGEIENTYIMKYFWDQKLARPDYYIQSVLLKLDESGEIDYKKILDKIILRHAMLYTGYSAEQGKLFYDAGFREKLDYYTIHIPEPGCDNLLEYIKEDRKNILNKIALGRSMLFQACLYRGAEHETYILLCAHHLVVDGMSWRIILEEFYTELEKIHTGEEVRIPNEQISFQEWSSRIREVRVEDNREREYWYKTVDAAKALLPAYRPAGILKETKVISYTFDQSFIEKMSDANQRYSTKTNELLIAALVKAVSSLVKQDSALLKIESHGREDIFEKCDVSRTVGWFTTFFPFVCRNYDDPEKHIIETKETFRKVKNCGIYYGLLVMNDPAFDMKLNDLISFNYLGEFTFDGKEGEKLFDVVQFDLESHELNKVFSAVDINAYILSGQLGFSIRYSSTYSEEEMERFKEQFVENIIQITDFCCSQNEKIFTPSDFRALNISMDDMEKIFDE